MRRAEGEREILVLSAVDPANPYGWVLPWPERDGPRRAAARRVAGASVVLVDGEPVLYVPPRSRKLATFPAADDRDTLIAAAAALDSIAARKRGKALRIEEIDGDSASSSPHAEPLQAAGFRSGYRGLDLELP